MRNEIVEIEEKLTDFANNAVFNAAFAETWVAAAEVVAAAAAADAAAAFKDKVKAKAAAMTPDAATKTAMAKAAARAALRVALRDAGRKAVGRDAVEAAGRDAGTGAGRDASAAVDAIAARDLIGKTFTQEHCDLLTKPMADFLAIVDGTDPGSLERDLATALLQTMSGAEVVATAKKILG